MKKKENINDNSMVKKMESSFSLKNAMRESGKQIPRSVDDDTKTQPEKKPTYYERLQHPKWQRKRLEIMQRDGFKCMICNDDETTLNVHHKEYSNEYQNPWDYPDDILITLCKHCHEEVEQIKKDNNDINYDTISGFKIKREDCIISFIKFNENGVLRIYRGLDNRAIYVFANGIDFIKNYFNSLK